ncbi:putative dna-dependent rna polymerase [Diaporthe ampelina]|uniref:DNA-directed RNA polymerase n=1 Tax=Diaporthe ampelina TaxID=1214573 RepID=A0A0G2IDE8_9PEZI|nr:putative dna-dependent rna polymerase [Diaporthe ampelina]
MDAKGAAAQIHELKHFNPAMVTMLEEPRRPPPPQKTNSKGIPGDFETALPVFDACLHVGKLDRAAAVLARVETLGQAPPEILMDMNNRYLEAWLRELKANPGLGKAEDLHAWYELHIHGAKLPQTPDTVAYMLKASLLTTSTTETPQGASRLERLVKRYMEMVNPEQGLRVLYCNDILSDADVATITRFYPEYNIKLQHAEEESSSLEEVTLNTTLGIGDAVRGSGDMGSLPEVLPTPQKGMGLGSIRATLDIFQKMKDGHDISALPFHERREFQSRLERDCIDVAVMRWREEHEALRQRGLATSVTAPGLNAHIWSWHQSLEGRIKKEFDAIAETEKLAKKGLQDYDRCMYGPILLQSTPARLAAITIMTTMSSLAFTGADKGIITSILVNHIAKIVEEDIQLQLRSDHYQKEARQAKAHRLLMKKLQSMREAEANLGPEAELAQDEKSATPIPEKPLAYNVPPSVAPWSLAMKVKIGAVLLSALAEVLKVPVSREHPETKKKITALQPGLVRTTQFKKGRRIGTILPHPRLGEMLREEPRGDFLARHLPMVVEPLPWTGFEKGAYQESPVPMVRLKTGEKDQRLYAEAAIARGDMDQVAKGLDVLGRTAWRINRPVLAVFLEVWNSGQALADIPPLHPQIAVPKEPEPSSDSLVRRNWIREIKTAQNLKQSYHSIRCFMNFQLEIARAYRDQEFFFPHNVDFRGRAYPVPPYLNHMGADHVRGLLRFSKGKELGERGLTWLKVHLSNVKGNDKASLKDRESFAMENLSNIFDSAHNPLKGNRWWLDAEDPWQCLAACMELTAALESPDPTKFISHLPVHQDGTCNGLQHYAALGGDSWGARQVNLVPGDKPADVYSAVADLVIKELDEDMARGNEFAKALHGKIKRKVVKQTVMTNVYGVTFTGAKKQVLKQLDALYPELHKESGIEAGLLSSYVTTKTFKALSTMFRGAHDIQHWLGEIGGRVCRALTAEQLKTIEEQGLEKPTTGQSKNLSDAILGMMRSTIIWTTPLRMPIVQPYRKTSSTVITTCMQSLVLNKPDRFDPVNRRKQLQAFPPNFIHSLDASHMILSALECDALGLTFAAVHDSFWTHAADVDTMNRVLRDAFIRIHSEDVIKRLASEFEVRYRGGLYMARVDVSSEAGEAILKWRKENKDLCRTIRDELLLEKKRLDLLNSRVKANQRKGRKMVTPGQIYEQFACEKDMAMEDMGGTTLGDLSAGDTKAKSVAMEDTDGIAEEAELDDADGETVPEAVADTTSEMPDYKKFYSTVSHFEEKLTGSKPAKKPLKRFTPVWSPLSFPDIPAKGDFDVKSLKDSEYFFS